MLRSSQHSVIRRDHSLPAPLLEKVDGEWIVPLVRELVEVPTVDGVHLVAVRKRPLDPAPKKGAILMVHGLGQNRYSWDLPGRSLANYFVAHGYEVLVADLRGHGLSRANGAPYPDSFEAYVQKDIPALVRKLRLLSGQDQVFYMGHSLGGAIGYGAAPDLQPHLRGLISIAGPMQFGQGSRLIPALTKTLKLLGKLSLIKPRDILPHVSADLLGSVLQRGMPYFDFPIQLFPLSLWYPRSIESHLLKERIRLGFDRTGVPIAEFMVRWGAAGHLMSSCGTIDYQQQFKRMQAPLLLVLGAQDAVVPAESMELALHQASSKDKTFLIFNKGPQAKGWGHMDIICGRAAPRVIWPALLDWIGQH